MIALIEDPLSRKPLARLERIRRERVRRTMHQFIAILAVVCLTTLYGVSVYASSSLVEKQTADIAPATENKKLEPAVIAPAPDVEIPVIKKIPKILSVAHAESVPVSQLNGGCSQYRTIIESYFGDMADAAIIVAMHESGCNQAAVSQTHDYCIFQINKEPATAKDINLCVRRAYEKWVGGRVGDHNWSAWYSVCTPGNAPRPKYEGIKCI